MSKLWEGIERALTLGEEFGIENVTAPLVGAFDEDVRRRIEEMRKKDPHFLGADLAAALLPMQKGESAGRRWGRGALGFGLGVVSDPLTYVAPGATKLGKAALMKKGIPAAGLTYGRKVPKEVLGLATAKSLSGGRWLTSYDGADILDVLRRLGGREGAKQSEIMAIRTFWDTIPDLPDSLQERFAQGMVSMLRFEVPFTRVEADLRSGLQALHLESLANVVDYPTAKVIQGTRLFASRVGALTGVGKVAKTLASGFTRTFGLGWMNRPMLNVAFRLLHEGLWSNSARTAKELAEKWGLENSELIEDAARELGTSANELRPKFNKIILDLVEQTKWDPSQGGLRTSFSEVKMGYNPSGEPLVVAFEPVTTKDVHQHIDEALDALRPSNPNLGGPANWFLDDEYVIRTRQHVISTHELMDAVAQREWDNGIKYSKIWGSGGYILRSTRLPDLSYHSDVMRMSRVVVPTALDSLLPRLQSAHKSFWTPQVVKRIKLGEMQSDPIFAKTVYKEVEKAVKHFNQTQGKGGISVEDVESLIHNFTLDEANVYVKKYGLKDSKGNWILRPGEESEFYKQNLPQLLASRVASGNAAIVRRHFVDTVKSLAFPYTHPNQIPDGSKAIKGIPKLSGYYLPEHEARHVESVWNAHKNTMSSIDKFLQWYDVPLRHWKAHTLGIFGAYHVRNFLGNMWQNWLAGVTAQDNISAAKLVHAINERRLDEPIKIGKKVFQHPVTGQTMTLRELYEYGIERNLWGVGEIGEALGDMVDVTTRQVNAEIRRLKLAKRAAGGEKISQWERARSLVLPSTDALSFEHFVGLDFKGVGWKKIQPEASPIVRLGAEAGRVLENHGKMAHVLNRLQKGWSLEDAVTSAKKHLFDYTELSFAERKVFRRFFPFYGWSRNNVPMQLMYLVKRPYRAASVGRTFRAVQQGTGVYGTKEPPITSEWFRKSGAIRWRQGKDGQDYFVTPVGTLPLYDLVESLDLLMWTKSNLAPFPARVIEQLANQDLMTGRAIDLLVTRAGDMRYITKGEKKRLFGVQLPRRIQHDVRNTVRLVRFWDDIIANPEGLDWASRVMRSMFVRDYPYNLDRSRASFIKAMTDMETNYRKALKSATSYGETRDAQRIQAQYGPEMRRLVDLWTKGRI